MKTLIIPVHSFVDVITNSSSEIFVSASKQTVKAIENIVDHILALGGSSEKSKDLFKIELASGYLTEDYDTVFLTDKELKAALKDGSVKFNLDEFGEDELPPSNWKPEPKDGTENSYIKVTALNESEQAKKTAELLSKLQNMFSGQDISSY